MEWNNFCRGSSASPSFVHQLAAFCGFILQVARQPFDIDLQDYMWQRGSGSHDSHGSGAHGHGDHEHGAHHEHHEHLERGQSLSHLEHHTNHDDTYLNLNSCWGGARTQQCCIDVSYFVKDKGITFSFKWHTAGLLDISWILGNLRKPEDSMSDVGLALISSGTTIFLAMISAIFAMRTLISELTHGDCGMRVGMRAGSRESYPPSLQNYQQQKQRTKYRWLVTDDIQVINYHCPSLSRNKAGLIQPWFLVVKPSSSW